MGRPRLSRASQVKSRSGMADGLRRALTPEGTLTDVDEAAAWQLSQWGGMYPDEGPFRRELYAKATAFFRAGAKYRQRLHLAANRVGKAQPLSEPVMTSLGPVAMVDVKVGTFVLGSEGYPTRVSAVHPQGIRKVVRIDCSDGSWSRCDRDHLWKVRRVSGGRAAAWMTITAGQIEREIALGVRFALPQRPVAMFQGACELPLDPYLLGLLLGDGGLSQRAVVLTTTDDEIVAYCREIAASYGCEFKRIGSQITYMFATTLRASDGSRFNVMADILDGLGVLGKNAHSKRVPALYLVADRADRLALLQGLMDTDGCVGRVNAARMFYSVSRDLCEDVAELARSLGIDAGVRQKNGRYKGEAHVSWLTHLPLDVTSVFRLRRKAERQREPEISRRPVMIESVVADGEEECQCISVEAQDGLYLTRHFMVTHNTYSAGYELTCHLTGHYPEWWQGRRFPGPIEAWVAGDNAKTTRNILQKVLLGPIDAIGTGMIPGHRIVHTSPWAGVPDAIETIWVRHETGRSSMCQLKSFDQGRLAFQGTEKHVIWEDEEPPEDIHGECLMRTMTCDGILMVTMTPLSGLTPFLEHFLSDADLERGDGELVLAKAAVLAPLTDIASIRVTG